MKQFSFPGGVKFAWNDPIFLSNIISSDTLKKRITKFFLKKYLLNLIAPVFDGKVIFYESSIDIFLIAKEMMPSAKKIEFFAIFINAKRNRPRIYIWGLQDKKPFFIKIGFPEDYSFFQNEYYASKHEIGIELFRVLKAKSVIKKRNYSAILLEGLTSKDVSQMQKLSGKEFLRYCLEFNLDLKDIFNGRMHGDLSNNNIYKLENKILILDWEFSRKRFPDFCDVIEIMLSLKKYRKKSKNKILLLIEDIKKEINIDITQDSVKNCLKHLSNLGKVLPKNF